MGSVLIGVVSSLVATFIFIGITHWFRTQFMPWYSDKIYRGVNVDGKWQMNIMASDNKTIDREFYLILNQHGDQLEGTFSTKDLRNAAVSTCMYVLKGEIRDRYLTMLLRPAARDFTDAGTLILQAYSPHNVLVLKGGLMCINPENVDVFASTDLEFVKAR